MRRTLLKSPAFMRTAKKALKKSPGLDQGASTNLGISSRRYFSTFSKNP